MIGKKFSNGWKTSCGARISAARSARIPIVNYGVLIAHLHGILHRALAALAAL